MSPFETGREYSFNFHHVTWNRGPSRSILLSVAAICFLVPACTSRQARFATPDEAANSLVIAVRSENSEEVQRILGRGSKEILSSGDEVADRQTRERFLTAYDEKNSLVTEPDGSVTMQVGADDWPMPIPIVESRNAWRFDTARGKDEILNRRVGRNELSVREVCLALVDAQREYLAMDPDGDAVAEYAQKLISDPGQKNGLYWETGPDEPSSPLGELVADAAEEGYRRQSGARRPYHGYHFKLLTAQGPDAPGGARDYIVNGRMTEGFAVLAWPAEYGNSGVMTFVVSHHGIIYERDLGRRTDRIADSMSVFDPDPEWTVE